MLVIQSNVNSNFGCSEWNRNNLAIHVFQSFFVSFITFACKSRKVLVVVKHSLTVDISKACRYVPFDFHHICGQLNFARLSELYDGIVEDLSRQR